MKLLAAMSKVFTGDEYLNPANILWSCVTSCTTLGFEEVKVWRIVALFAAVKKKR